MELKRRAIIVKETEYLQPLWVRSHYGPWQRKESYKCNLDSMNSFIHSVTVRKNEILSGKGPRKAADVPDKKRDSASERKIAVLKREDQRLFRRGQLFLATQNREHWTESRY